MKIPKCMSTQHPDNARIPFFSDNSVIEGEAEIKEAYYVFSHLKCEEQMWDYEGKEVDNFVIKKLLTRYEYFFKEHVIGEEVFITLRVPNPSVEKAEAKILLETLESIPRSYDVAKLFYGRDVVPIFEVINPMTTSANEINRIYEYYKRFVHGKGKFRMWKESLSIEEWIGKFLPEEINVIPLVEDKKSMFEIGSIIKDYLKGKNIEKQRVFLARSDPALNYGLISAVLMSKIALYELSKVEEEESVDIFPIIGKGGSPFRGNLNPYRVEKALEEYPYVHTFTVQSSFKYDYEEEKVRDAIEKIKEKRKGKAIEVGEEVKEIMERYSKRYAKEVESIADLINKIAEHVPSRRRRKLHVGLFGYSRKLGKKKLPRAIKFTASLYSLGIPPEIIGIDVLSEKDFERVREVYKKVDLDLKDSLRFLNKRNLVDFLPSGKRIVEAIEWLGFEIEEEEKHRQLTDEIRNLLNKGDEALLKEKINDAAVLRKFLG